MKLDLPNADGLSEEDERRRGDSNFKICWLDEMNFKAG